MKWKLREKVLVLSVLSALLPFAITNIYWYTNAQDTTKKNAANTILLATSQASDKVNDFLNTTLLGVLAHAQSAALLNGDNKIIQQDILQLLLQNTDIERIAYADSTGQEQVKVDKQHIYTNDELENIAGTDAFKIATFRYGKEYISPVKYGQTPHIVIATPVTYAGFSQSLQTFSSFDQIQRNAEDIRGVLITEISLNTLINRLNVIKVDQTGYVYLIDKEFKILSNQDSQRIGTVAHNLPQQINAIAQDTEIAKPSEPDNGVSTTETKVLRSYETINRTGWTLITEVPLSDISDDIMQIQRQSLILSLVPLAALLIISLFFAQKLIKPIQYLVKGTQNITQGNYDFNFTPVKTGDEIEQLANAYTEMAKQIKHEQSSLHAEKNTLSTVLESIVDGVVALNREAKIVFLNHAAASIMRLNEEHVIGVPLSTLVTLKEENEEVSLDQILKEPKKMHKLTISLSETESKVVNLILAELTPYGTTDISYLLTFYDISKEQELENMKLDFVSMAAHELRTPLTAIKGYLSYLQEEIQEKLTKEEEIYLSRVIISSSQLSSLIENLLNVTKIERGVLKLDIASFSIEKMIEDSLINLKEVAIQKHILITFDKPKSPIPNIRGDQFRINQVFTNLVSNAINYTQPDGTVKITIDNRPDGIVVNVADNGQGIPKSALPHLFTKFYRVGGSLEQGSKGTGLGLFISKSIIERHNGKIWVESEEGKGSTFSFMLPSETV